MLMSMTVAWTKPTCNTVLLANTGAKSEPVATLSIRLGVVAVLCRLSRSLEVAGRQVRATFLFSSDGCWPGLLIRLPVTYVSLGWPGLIRFSDCTIGHS